MAPAEFAFEGPMYVAVTDPRGKIPSFVQEVDFRPLARALGTVKKFPADAMIFSEGDRPRCMYVVLKGKIELSARRRAVETIGEGEALGGLSLIDEKPRRIAARASKARELALLDKETFRTMVKQAPDFVWFVLGEPGSQ